MRREQRLEVADLLRDVHIQRLRLAELHAELDEQREPLSALEARLLLTTTDLRLLYLEERLWALNHHARRRLTLPPRFRFPGARDRLRRALARARYERTRLRALVRPRIGILRHYQPKPLELPAGYLDRRMPDPAPSISIVTPCLQHGVFLERTIRSVLEQGYPALEYFVQDGGSNDGTDEILRRYEDRLAGWVSEKDGGQADAINRAFARTSGEIMAWLNSDDLLLPGALAYVGRFFAAHPEVDVVYGNRILVDLDDCQIGAWVLPPHDDLALTLADYVPQETLFWRRRIWEAAGGRLDPSFKYALDWDLLLRFRDAGATMIRLPRFIGAFRIHDEQKTSASQPVGLAEMARLRERVHGRPLEDIEIHRALKPYFRRHVILHLRQRLLDRLPLSRIAVGTSRRGAGQLVFDGTGERTKVAPATAPVPVHAPLTTPSGPTVPE